MRSFCCFFLFQDDEDFLLLFVLFLSDSTFAEIYTLSSPTYHICSALQFLLRFFLPFSIHYFIQYLEGNSDLKRNQRNRHRKILNDFELKAMTLRRPVAILLCFSLERSMIHHWRAPIK